MWPAFESRHQVVHEAYNVLRDLDFDTVVVRGVSGLLIGPIIAYVMDKKLLVVRKPPEAGHSAYVVEGSWGKRAIIVDDFICSGETIRSIGSELSKVPDQPEIIGVYIYHPKEGAFRGPETIPLAVYGPEGLIKPSAGMRARKALEQLTVPASAVKITRPDPELHEPYTTEEADAFFHD